MACQQRQDEPLYPKHYLQHVRSGKKTSDLGRRLFGNIEGIRRLHHAQARSSNELSEEPVKPVGRSRLQCHSLSRLSKLATNRDQEERGLRLTTHRVTQVMCIAILRPNLSVAI